MPTEEEVLKMFSGEATLTPEEIKAAQKQMQQFSPFEILQAVFPLQFCPECSELHVYGECPKCHLVIGVDPAVEGGDTTVRSLICPHCGGVLQEGNGDDTPPWHCPECGVGWDTACWPEGDND